MDKKRLIGMKRLVADKTLEADFFKDALQKVEVRRRSHTQFWRAGIYDQIRELLSMQGKLSIERMCQLASVSRAGFYRLLLEQEPGEEDMEVRSHDPENLRGATNGATAIEGLALCCGVEECW